MKISRDRKNIKLILSQVDYIEKVLQNLFIENEKDVNISLPNPLKLTKEMCPKTQEKEANMSKIQYASIVGCLMYVMVCTRLDITHLVRVFRRYMSHP